LSLRSRGKRMQLPSSPMSERDWSAWKLSQTSIKKARSFLARERIEDPENELEAIFERKKQDDEHCRQLYAEYAQRKGLIF
jgi:hypothetical protein